MYTDVSSSLEPVWAFAVIGWGAMFVAAAEVSKDAQSSTLLGLRAAVSKSERA
jgi:hypothetical protein